VQQQVGLWLSGPAGVKGAWLRGTQASRQADWDLHVF